MASRIVPTPGVSPDGWVSVGVIARAHGIRGALRFHPWNEESAVLRSGIGVQLGHPQGWRDYCVITYARPQLTLEGICDRTSAEALQGLEVRVRRSDFPDDSDTTWLVDLVNAEVVNEQGHVLGRVVGFSDNGAQALLEVDTPAGEVLLPFVEPLVQSVTRADAGHAARVVVRPPGGLFDDAALVDETPDDGGSGAKKPTAPTVHVAEDVTTTKLPHPSARGRR